MSKKDDYFPVMKNTNELFMFFKGIFEKNKCKIIKKMKKIFCFNCFFCFRNY